VKAKHKGAKCTREAKHQSDSSLKYSSWSDSESDSIGRRPTHNQKNFSPVYFDCLDQNHDIAMTQHVPPASAAMMPAVNTSRACGK
jgi:hypothetical protein